MIRSAARGQAQTAVATFVQPAFRRWAALLAALVCLALAGVARRSATATSRTSTRGGA